MSFVLGSSVFGTKPKVPPGTTVIFVADMFVDDYVGGAELTTEALINASSFPVFKLRSKDVTEELMTSQVDKFWIFGNFSALHPQLINQAMMTLRYGVVEYDYKYCRFRSPEKHLHETNLPCDCANKPHGQFIARFFQRAMKRWWMSERQLDRYETLFPFLGDGKNVVLSSVFDRTTLDHISRLRKTEQPRKGWIVLGSNSWIKGAHAAEEWCTSMNKEYQVVWNLPYHDLLQKMSTSEGFVYLPQGGDTCPRMVIEAKLLGCKLHINDDVQHAREPWFDTDDTESIKKHLLASPSKFWAGVKEAIEHKPTISGYTTTYNCVKQAYPFKECIKSMLQFCDEVCVVDGGSTDGTWEELQALAAENAIRSEPTIFKLKIKQIKRDWSSKHHPVFDGMQKAEARRMCTKEFCWQMDSDEIVHEDDAPKISSLCRLMPPDVDVLSLPVIEYWGGPDKVRCDIQPWKWRLSRNLPHVTHGIPFDMKRQDSDGNIYAVAGTDGCDMINATTGERLPHASFYSQDVENVRQLAVAGDENARKQYEQWFNAVITGLPSVFHYSWYDLERKIRLYRDYWQNHWNALWNKDASDSAENNMMFGVPWKDVTDEMIVEKANQMRNKLGGWIWHRPWDGLTRTGHIQIVRSQPESMKSVKSECKV